MDKTLLEVGYHKHEMDFGISGAVCNLSLKQLKEFREMIIVAIWQAEDMWRREQVGTMNKRKLICPNINCRESLAYDKDQKVYYCDNPNCDYCKIAVSIGKCQCRNPLPNKEGECVICNLKILKMFYPKAIPR